MKRNPNGCRWFYTALFPSLIWRSALNHFNSPPGSVLYSKGPLLKTFPTLRTLEQQKERKPHFIAGVLGLTPQPENVHHRVDRVLGFLSSIPNRDPYPITRRRVCPPFGSGMGGGGTHSLAREGVGDSQNGRGDRLCGTLGMYVLCDVLYMLNREYKD